MSGGATHKTTPRKLLSSGTASARNVMNSTPSNKFLSSMYSSPPVKTSSMMSVISRTAPAKSRNVKVE